ncbi:MAG: 6-aminohexanoate hydrolase, partial [Cyanobacteriota bacterium]|nr:6-aminohexanoate hydrolase [Cyanobacteriota bacterium]
ELSESQAQLNQRLDSFIFSSQRLLTQQAERLIRLEGQTERLEGIVQMLARNYQELQRSTQEFQRTSNAALERIDRILDYLLGQNPGNS